VQRRHRFLWLVLVAGVLSGCSSSSSGGSSASDRPSASASPSTSSPTPTTVLTTSPTIQAPTPTGSTVVPTPNQPMSDEQWAASFGVSLERRPDVQGQPVWLDAKGRRVFVPSCSVAQSVTRSGGPYAGDGYVCRS
jgi:hypothetical protein